MSSIQHENQSEAGLDVCVQDPEKGGFVTHCRNDFRAAIPKFFADTKKFFATPTTQVITFVIFLLGAIGNTFVSRIIESFWEAAPPKHVLKLNEELRETSAQMKQSSSDLSKLAASITSATRDNPAMTEQLQQLDAKLVELNTLVQQASGKTDKVATISEALRDDWVRLNEKRDRTIDSVPDLVLASGEGVQLCNGMTSLGVNQMQGGRVWLTVAEKPAHLKSGGRLSLNDEAFIDFIGNKNGKSLFKVRCNEA